MLEPQSAVEVGREEEELLISCAHHWQIATPNGEMSEGTCKFCGATRSFLNSTRPRTMTRNTKPTPGQAR